MRNDTTRFILPILFPDLKDKIINEHFINAYIWNDKFPEEEYIALVYKNPNDYLSIFEPELIENYKDTIIYYFKMPDNVKKAVLDIMKGKYSQLSTLAKTYILNFWNLSKHSRMHNILYPKDYLYETSGVPPVLYKKGEIWPKPNTSKETLIYN